MTRPRNADRSIVPPSVARKGTEGILAPARWRAAPSSTGAGIVDQSGVPTVLCIVALRRAVAPAKRSTRKPATVAFQTEMRSDAERPRRDSRAEPAVGSPHGAGHRQPLRAGPGRAPRGAA